MNIQHDPHAVSPGNHPAIRVSRLSKTYGSLAVVDDVSFDVSSGTITGFLGPNGAGKSTTLRMLVGLAQPTAGHTAVLGTRYHELPNPGRRVGVLLDAAAQHSGRTGLEVLRLGAMVMGLPAARAGEMIERVGLSASEARRRTGTYSLGMRQRLGIGHALLGGPRVLILDEPANGLDPAGIRWMRRLLREFADAGGAVLLSSHLLHEVEAIADNLVVIGRGRIVAQGPKVDLLAPAGTFARSANQHALTAALRAADLSFTVTDDGGHLIDADPDRVAAAVATAHVMLSELRPAGGGLEQLFLSLTSEDNREDMTA